jgi:hypothetical protein
MSTLRILLLVTLLGIASAVQEPTALPETPQGKHVRAYVEAVNSGDVKKFLAMIETHLAPSLVAKRTPEEHTEMFNRVRGDFEKLKITKVTRASAEGIDVIMPDQEGNEATFSFTFETAAPHRITGIRVAIGG